MCEQRREGKYERDDSLFHQRDTATATHILRRILTCCKEHRGHDVGSVRVVATDATRHRAPDEVLAYIQPDERGNRALEDLPDHISWDDCFRNDTLATSINPVDRRRLLIRAVITRD